MPLDTTTRREALKKTLLISTASIITLLGASKIMSTLPKEHYTIKVAYFGFSTVQTTGVNEEYFTLPAPVSLQDVLSQIKEKHVVFTAMLPLMAINVNGITADGNPQLSNNSEIDFIPTLAGG